MMSCVGLLIGYLGLSLIHLKAWHTVNGQLEWSVNSRWFFLAAVVLGAASVTVAAWKKASRRCTTTRTITGAAGNSEDEPSVSPNDQAGPFGNPR